MGQSPGPSNLLGAKGKTCFKVHLFIGKSYKSSYCNFVFALHVCVESYNSTFISCASPRSHVCAVVGRKRREKKVKTKPLWLFAEVIIIFTVSAVWDWTICGRCDVCNEQ